ncbi:MAG: RNA-dependent DNA polymerase, partial [Anaerolineae bacterium]|nr:RNA-dependent DNA polymerase [Anaerolineae bacterium]
YRRVKGRKVVAYRRRLKRLYQGHSTGDIDQDKVVASIQGWLAHIRTGDTHGLAKQTLQPIVF